MSKVLHGCLAVAMLAGVQSAQAQRATQVLSAASAQAIVDGCRKHAEAGGKSQAIAVIDAGGNPVASLRMDRVTPAVMAFATEKATAAALWGFATADMANAVKAVPGFANAPHVVALPGGLPIFTADGKTLLGGAGASGESPDEDLACVQAGITAAGLTSQRAGVPPR